MNQQDKINLDIEAYLKAGGTIQAVDSSHNKDAQTKFRDTNAGPRYVNKDMATSRQRVHDGRVK